MATTKSYTPTLLVILILFHYKAMSCEGRHLAEKANKLCEGCLGKGIAEASNRGEMVGGFADSVDAVMVDHDQTKRSGQSPSVGRSFHDEEIKKNGSELFGGYGDSADAVVNDDDRPTVPGHSPGVGH